MAHKKTTHTSDQMARKFSSPHPYVRCTHAWALNTSPPRYAISLPPQGTPSAIGHAKRVAATGCPRWRETEQVMNLSVVRLRKTTSISTWRRPFGRFLRWRHRSKPVQVSSRPPRQGLSLAWSQPACSGRYSLLPDCSDFEPGASELLRPLQYRLNDHGRCPSPADNYLSCSFMLSS